MDFRSKYDNENIITDTSSEQASIENIVERLFYFQKRKAAVDPASPTLLRHEHINFLKKSITTLPGTYSSLDCSRSWLCYWICHSLRLLKSDLGESQKSAVTKFLKTCQNPLGGFGGGPDQAPHLASTYAVVNALCCLNTREAFEVIDREALKNFLWATRSPNGAFCLEIGGEIDVRGAYCAISVATLTNLETTALFDKTARWIITCQTYEGGFAGYPGAEAHGGYTFCGIAALALLNSVHLCDIKSLLRWCVNRQMTFEGGFQGRTNKLVDSCYSFWVGGVFPIMYAIMNEHGSGDGVKTTSHLFNNQALQEYILMCCQDFQGGLLDKPKKSRDAIHTCYALSGLSVAQHQPDQSIDTIGHCDNELETLHPLYNLERNCLRNALTYFASQNKV